MNPIKLYIAKELLTSAKDAYDKHKHKSPSGNRGNHDPYGYGYAPVPPPQYGYPAQYGYAPSCNCQCGRGGGGTKGNGGTMKFISAIKNSKHVQSLPQTLQGLAALRHGHGGHGGVKNMIPQVLKGFKSRI